MTEQRTIERSAGRLVPPTNGGGMPAGMRQHKRFLHLERNMHALAYVRQQREIDDSQGTSEQLCAERVSKPPLD